MHASRFPSLFFFFMCSIPASNFLSMSAVTDGTDGSMANLVDVLFCDDILFHILCTCLDVLWHASAARVCTRWYAVLASVPRDGNKCSALIDQTVDRETRDKRTPPFVKRWAERARLLSTRSTVRFLHQGHLNGAASGGHERFEAWVRAQQPEGLSCAHDDESTSYSAASALCVRKASDIWAMIRGGRIEEIEQNNRDAADTVGHECHRRAISMIVVDIVCAADLDVLRRLHCRGLLHTDSATWTAAAQADRIDALEWLRSVDDECLYFRLSSTPNVRHVNDITLARVAHAAADACAFRAVRWLGDRYPSVTIEWYEVYWVALARGHMPTLDWMASCCFNALDSWDRCVWQGKYLAEWHPSAWRAICAPTSDALRWLARRGVAMPRNLLVWDSYDETCDNDTQRVPGSVESMTYVVDVHGCDPPDTDAFWGMAHHGRSDLLAEAHARRWITRELYARMHPKAIRRAKKLDLARSDRAPFG